MDRKSTQSSINSHKTIGYAIGLLGLFVSCIVIYGVGGPLFPNRRLSKEDKEKGYYENFVPIIASELYFSKHIKLSKQFYRNNYCRVSLFGIFMLVICCLYGN